jgi:hypothetical protein
MFSEFTIQKFAFLKSAKGARFSTRNPCPVAISNRDQILGVSEFTFRKRCPVPQPAVTEMIFFFGFFPPIMITLALKFDTSSRGKSLFSASLLPERSAECGHTTYLQKIIWLSATRPSG